MQTIDKKYQLTAMRTQDHLRQKSMWSGDKCTIDHPLKEIRDNCIDECIQNASVVLINEIGPGHFMFLDNGRGLPEHIIDVPSIDSNGEENHVKMNSVIANCTQAFVSGKHDNSNYQNSKGTYGIGMKLVNSLSTYFICEIKQNNRLTNFYKFINFNEEIISEKKEYDKDIPFSTKIEFQLNENEFETFDYNKDYFELCFQLVHLYHLNKKFFFNGKEIEKITKHAFFNKLFDLNKKESDILITNNKNEDVNIDLFFCFDIENYLNQSNGKSDVNFDFCLGKHIDEFKKIYVDCLHDIYPESKQFTIREKTNGIFFYMSIKMSHPKYQSQVKENIKVSLIDFLLGFQDEIRDYIKKNNDIKTYIKYLRENRENKLLVKEIKKKNKRKRTYSSDDNLHIPSINNPGEILYLIEGDSAAGTVKQCYDSRTDGIFKLTGKILNVLDIKLEKVIKSKKISLLANAMGFDFEKYLNKQKQTYRYKKIRCLTDADPDGKHISILVSIFFVRFMPDILESENFEIIIPPLYKTYENNKFVPIYKTEDIEKHKNIEHLKGIGSMSADELQIVINNPILYSVKNDLSIETICQLSKNIHNKQLMAFSGNYSADDFMEILTN